MTTQPIHEVEEHATAKILQVIKEVQPAVIFLDSLCNTHTQACPNLPELLRRLPKICTQETYLVIDNTCLCLGLDPLQFLPKTFHHLKLLVFESLNKYFQFGLDRTTGGIVWGLSADESKLFYARLHAGTNITNTSTLMLPTPNRLLLEQRLARLRRNREYMATRLAKFVHAQKTIIERVVSPCLAIHPAYAWASKYSFAGSNLVLQFKTSKQHPRQYQRFIGKVMTEAKKRSVPLNVGTSFGFDISRVYLTALHTEFGTPFIRISVGTETLPEIETLAQIFEQCILQ